MEENKNIEKVERVVEIRKGDGVAPANTTNYVNFAPAPKKKYSPMVQGIRSTAIWVMIFSAVVLAMVCIMAIWVDLSDVLGKAWATFFVVGLAGGFIALIAPLLDKTER